MTINVREFKRDMAIVALCSALSGFAIGWMISQDVAVGYCSALVHEATAAQR